MWAKSNVDRHISLETVHFHPFWLIGSLGIFSIFAAQLLTWDFSEMNANGEKFDSKTDRRILNLEKFSHLSPVASSTSAVLQKQTLL